MEFQSQVNKNIPVGWSGSFGSNNLYYAVSLMAGEPIVPGRFVSVVPQANPNNIPINPDTAVMGGTDAIGISIRNRIGRLDPIRESSRYEVPAGWPVEAVVHGDMLIVLDQAAAAAGARGMKLFYRETNSAAAGQPSNAGEIQIAAAGGTIPGFIESKWYYVKPLDLDGTGAIYVSTWRPR